jgi:hypothetical protein
LWQVGSQLERSHILLKEVFKLLVSEHFVDEFEDDLFVILIKPLYQAHLFNGSFVL